MPSEESMPPVRRDHAAGKRHPAVATQARPATPRGRTIRAATAAASEVKGVASTAGQQPDDSSGTTTVRKRSASRGRAQGRGATTAVGQRRSRAAASNPASALKELAAAPANPIAPSPAAQRVPFATAQLVRRAHREGMISPENTVFVSLCFEGPDVYSTAGGLGTRVTEFTESLAQLGYETHLIFVGDPNEPSVEQRVEGRLHLERWSQWISKYYPNGVYDGEEQKLYDFNDTVPYHVYKDIAEPAIAQGKIVVIIGEDWHTAEAICRTSDLLHWNKLRHRALIMWNCNSLMSLHRINWGRLNYTCTITTVSRYMKHRLWANGVNPLVIPNGIPSRYLEAVSREHVDTLRDIMRRGDPERIFLFKIGRFDPDKRWLMAVEAIARLKYSGHPVSLIIRGGLEPHGGEVLTRARALGLHVKDIEARRPTPEVCLDLLRDAGDADIYNLSFFVPAEFVRVCNAAADAVLANSGHEPFGLVGLEVMAAGGVAFTGSTGEEYVISFENAVALETDDPDEIVGYLLHMLSHPEEQVKIRSAGKHTAAEFTWEEVIDNLIGKLGYLARKQSLVLD
jgi:glycosyltransferase involved in cell wall biosynthesis